MLGSTFPLQGQGEARVSDHGRQLGGGGNGSTDGVSGIGLDSDGRAGSGSQVDGTAFVGKQTGEVGAGLSWVQQVRSEHQQGLTRSGRHTPSFNAATSLVPSLTPS